MKNFYLLLALFLAGLTSNAQIASRLLTGQSHQRPINTPNFLFVDTLPGGEYRIWVANRDSLKILPFQLKWLKDSVTVIGDQKYVQLAGAYTNPAWVNSLSAGKVFGLSSVATTGDYNDLTNKPNLNNYYLNSNPNGYISGINSSLVTGALGYTPVTNSRTLSINGTTYDLSTNRSWTVGDLLSSGSYSNPSWLTSLDYSKLINVPIPSAPSYNNAPARSLNSSFKPSTTKPTRVSYTVSIATTLSLLNLNSSGVAYLEISADNSSWTTINSAGITRTLAVSISVGLNDTSLINIAGEIPANYYCRIRTVTSGGATVGFSSGQEVTY